MLPPELRKVARRSAGFVDDPGPDGPGSAPLARASTKVPDPLRASLRESGGRGGWANRAGAGLALGFGPEPNGQIRGRPDAGAGRVPQRKSALAQRGLRIGATTPDQALERRRGRRTPSVRRRHDLRCDADPG